MQRCPWYGTDWLVNSASQLGRCLPKGHCLWRGSYSPKTKTGIIPTILLVVTKNMYIVYYTTRLTFLSSLTPSTLPPTTNSQTSRSRSCHAHHIRILGALIFFLLASCLLGLLTSSFVPSALRLCDPQPPSLCQASALDGVKCVREERTWWF